MLPSDSRPRPGRCLQVCGLRSVTHRCPRATDVPHCSAEMFLSNCGATGNSSVTASQALSLSVVDFLSVRYSTKEKWKEAWKANYHGYHTYVKKNLMHHKSVGPGSVWFIRFLQNKNID